MSYNPISQRPEVQRKLAESCIMGLIIKGINLFMTFDQKHFASMYSAHFLPIENPHQVVEMSVSI